MPQVLENANGTLYPLPRGVFITGFDRPQALTLVNGGLGTVLTRRRLEPVKATLAGSFKRTSYADAQAALDELLAFLHAQPLKVYSAAGDRHLLAFTEGSSDVDTSIARLVRFRVPLVAPDPLWTGIEVSDGPRSVTGTSTFAILNPGTAPAPVRLTITATSANRPKVENLTTGQEAELLLSVASGNTWVMDGGLHTVARNGSASNDAAGNAFLVGGFHLAPGVNELWATCQAGSYSLTLDWVTRWY